jgi:integrase
MIETLWSTDCRIGELNSLDVKDFDAEERSLAFRHRPDTGTTLLSHCDNRAGWRLTENRVLPAT